MRVIKSVSPEINADGFYAQVELDDGTELGLVPLTLGRMRVTEGPPSNWSRYRRAW